MPIQSPDMFGATHPKLSNRSRCIHEIMGLPLGLLVVLFPVALRFLELAFMRAREARKVKAFKYTPRCLQYVDDMLRTIGGRKMKLPVNITHLGQTFGMHAILVGNDGKAKRTERQVLQCMIPFSNVVFGKLISRLSWRYLVFHCF